MAVRSQGRQYADRRKMTEQSGYVYGNTVKKLDITRVVREKPSRQVSLAARKNREKAMYMNLRYVLFLMSALAAAGFILIGYIRLQSDITNSIQHISSLESQLNDLKRSNDEEYSRIESSVNLAEIKRIAIEELGMTYASEGQVVNYSSEGSDYVRQVSELPK